MSRYVSVVTATAVAMISTVLGNWMVANFGLSADATGIAAFCATWIALYPFVRLNRPGMRWRHWARGAIIVLALWLLLVLSR